MKKYDEPEMNVVVFANDEVCTGGMNGGSAVPADDNTLSALGE